ncbi:MAG: helix-turn-helix transcriptional regulator, partial [Kiritimatiellae bacterium]|nr:helix-turn-helix transcriptional regulator [Kiritimatiellia bacterium]
GRWVAALPPRCAVFAANDNCACDVAAAFAAAKRAVPRMNTIVGADGFERTAERPGTMSRISSVKIDREAAGFITARALGENFRGVAFFGPVMAVRRDSTRGHGRREPFALEAVAMIRREAADGLTARALAARFPGSRNLFERRFREALGHSVLDEILHVRLEKVQVLLSRPDVPIGAIAALCGFGCDYELRKLFRARFGMSMREWRKARF